MAATSAPSRSKAARLAKAEGEGRLGRDQWIDAAILALQDCSIELLRVDNLATALGVTKGSFYHHFNGREQLLEAVLAKWKSTMTGEIDNYILRSVGTPMGRIRRLIRIAVAPRPNVPGGPLEVRLREWAHRNAHVAAVVKEVDEHRLAFLQKLYQEAGLTADKARRFAFLHMSYVIGSRIFLDGKSEADYAEGVDLGEEFLFP